MNSNPDALIAELDALLGIGGPAKPAGSEPPPGVAFYQVPPPAPVPAPPPAPAAVLPIHVKLAAPAQIFDAQPAAPPPRAPRILVVDDNDDYREAVKFVLQDRGYEVVEAMDGADGVRKAMKAPPELALVDFNMPNLNGYELIQQLRAGDETRNVPIIMFTGASNRRHLRAMGMDISDFLEKPVSNNQLLSAIAGALARGPQPRISLPPAPHEPAPGPSAYHTQSPSELRPDMSAPAPFPPAQGGFVPMPSAGEAALGNGPAVPLPPAQAPVLPPVQAGPAEAPPDLESHPLEMLDDAQTDDLSVEQETEDVPEEAGLEVLANDHPLVAKVNKILIKAVEMGASDIHIEPEERQITVRIRVNGSLQKLCTLPAALAGRLSARIKIMSSLVITERRLPQDGQFRAKIKGKKVEFRVSVLPGIHGEKVVMRVLGGSKISGTLTDLGLSVRDKDVIQRALQTPHGLILVTGPTGSGKTTTLYTMIGMVNAPDVNVMTAEDPVEYEVQGITQVHVKSAIGLTFEAVLRSFLRQDPDVMLIGEIRDLETAQIAVKASITGHLVFSTLHTNSAPASIMRMTHMGVAPFLVAASVKLIIAQRLVKVLCQSCKLPVPLSDDDKKILTETELAGISESYRSVGCRLCSQTGYKGRMPIFEVMPVKTPEMRQRILGAGHADAINELAVQEGMTTLRQAALNAVAEGKTSLAEAMKIILAE